MKNLLYILIACLTIVIILAFPYKHQKDSNMPNNKTLVAYFSATKNTEDVAGKLAHAIDADLFEIVPEQPYSDQDLDWQNDSSRSSLEMANKNSRPKIANTVPDISQYNTIFIGFPIWWGREPSIIDTFMESYDFSNKTIVPFATSGTSDIGDSGKNMQSLSPNAHVFTGKRFTKDVPEEELKSWASKYMK